MKVTLTSILLCVAMTSFAQWNVNGTHVNNTNTGNLGIGTGAITPTAKLHVNQSSNTEWASFIYNAGGSGKGLLIKAASPSNAIPILQVNDLSDNNRFMVQSDGKVGIGIATPAEVLHINGSVRGTQPGGALKINTEHGYTSIGAQNPSWSHFYTSLPRFYFNKPLTVDGAFSSYNTGNLFLQTGGLDRITVLNSNGYTGIGTSTPKSILHVEDCDREYQVNRAIVGQTENAAGKNYLLLHKAYDGATLADDNFVMGKITGIRGGTAAWNRKFTVEVNTASAYQNDRGSLISYSETTQLVTVRYQGVKYIALEIDNGSPIYYFSFTGYTKNEQLQLVYDQDVTEPAAFNQTDPLVFQGNVGIGTGMTMPDAKLTVKGNIHTQEVKVDLLGAVAPDYVFEETYDLQSLEEVEAYIKQNKHLPEVPSAKEMEENGVNLKEMNMLLLKKVEELTLHMIELKKENEKQNEVIKTLLNK